MDYEFKTTFWTDFTIADKFGINAIKDTFNRAFKEWKTDYIYLTELVMVLNWKMWAYEKDQEYCNLYYTLWEKAKNYALNNLKGEELSYYFDITD